MTIVVSPAGFAGIAHQPFGTHSCLGIMTIVAVPSTLV